MTTSRGAMLSGEAFGTTQVTSTVGVVDDNVIGDRFSIALGDGYSRGGPLTRGKVVIH